MSAGLKRLVWEDAKRDLALYYKLRGMEEYRVHTSFKVFTDMLYARYKDVSRMLKEEIQ